MKNRESRFHSQRGQSIVEFALSMTAFVSLMVGAIQLALIGNAALAVSQLAYAGARYAAVNPTYTADQISTYMKGIAPSTINENSGENLNITVEPSTTPRTFGAQVKVSINYSLTNKLFLPHSFLGVTFPTSLNNISAAMMTE
jgi:Flp pilus assembly protein TadG